MDQRTFQLASKGYCYQSSLFPFCAVSSSGKRKDVLIYYVSWQLAVKILSDVYHEIYV